MKKTTSILASLLSGLLTSYQLYAQEDYGWSWAKQAGGSYYDDIGYGISVDAAGNSYVTGYFKGTATFGSFTLIGAGNYDIFVAKYDTNGNVLWAKQAGGGGDDYGRSISVDAAGNSYVTGSFRGTATFGSITLTSAGNYDIFVAKYDANGNVLWAKQAGGSSYDNGYGISVDSAGNSYVTGRFVGTATFGSTTLTGGGGFVAKYDANGTVLWVKKAGGSSADEGRGISVDAAGNSYVTGHFKGTATFGDSTLTSAGNRDIFVAKYDANGTVLWAKQAGGSYDDYGNGISVDAAGNSYVTGRFAGTATFGSSITLTSAGFADVFVAKYDANGNVLWAKRAGGSYDDYGNGISVDAAGNSYVTGDFYGTATFDSITLTSAGYGDVFVAKYDANGTVLWAINARNKWVRGISVDTAGDSYVTGSFSGTTTFGSSTLTSAGSGDVFVAKLSPCSSLNIPTPTITAGGAVTFCQGDSVVLSAPLSDNYIWSNDSTTQNITVNASGNFTVRTISGGCTSAVSQAVQVTVNPLPTTPTISANGATTFCQGDSVTLSAPAGFGYIWSNGATTQSITVSASGNFTVRTISAQGCTSAVSQAVQVTVNQSSATSIPASICSNALPYSFNGQSLTASGTYTATLTNSVGCDSVVTLNLTVDTVTASFTVNANELTALPANANYQWLLNGSPINGANSQIYTITQDGSYAVIITQNGCSDTSAAQILTVTRLRNTVQSTEINVYPNPNNGTFSVQGENMQHVAVLDVTGKVVFTQKVNNENLTNVHLQNATKGVYLVRILTSNGIATKKIVVE